ncbi:MAG: Gfo/Idh/MocA family oxidoreductase [Devosia nanyangense]|uniref:Gfo/Idh/MocA family oxidoreductase n=1 Tax=Devosia nanyangense TaxID=1228055 RepID=A0A933L481_9HYPH|nr:Gfo/Idh/MocA family oxidoreductase [Devosia nanyangense]
MAELRIAILGSGYMGRTHAECITRHVTRAKLVAISGGRRAPGLAADYGAAYEPTYEALLARGDVDSVLVATPHADHCAQVMAAAEAGKHVLVEKPMATSVADCTRMIEACDRAGVRLEVIQTQRFRGALWRTRKLIADGAIGKIRMLQGRSLFTSYVVDSSPWAGEDAHGGAFLDTGVHFFDLMRFLTGAEPQSVFATLKTFGEVPYGGLNAMTQLTFADGAIAQHWMSYQIPKPSLPNSEHRYVIVGETGMIDVDAYGKVQLAKDDQWTTVWEQPPIDYVNRPLDPVRLEAFFTQTQAFVDDVLDDRPATVSGAEGRAAVALVEAAWRSSRLGVPVQLI